LLEESIGNNLSRFVNEFEKLSLYAELWEVRIQKSEVRSQNLGVRI
jgi:hypothetical protein